MKKILLILALTGCFLFASPAIATAGDGHEVGYQCQSNNDCPSSQRTNSGAPSGESNQSADSSVASVLLYLLTAALPKG